MGASHLAPPERPRQLRSHFIVAGPWLTFSWRGFDPSGLFLLLWLIGWTVGCIFLIGMALQQPGVMNLLFAVPFWAAWIFVFCAVLNSFFRRETFELGPEGIRFTRRVIVVLARRAIPLDEIHRFRSYSSLIDSETGSRQWGLEVETSGRGLRFGRGLPDAERAWLIFQLNEHLARLTPGIERLGFAIEPAEENALVSAAGAEAAGERMAPAPVPLAPPSDCRWQRWYDFRDLGFAMRGRFRAVDVGTLLFLNAFWNGIVGFFVSQLFFGGDAPLGWAWWGMFVFMIPFEAIGLAIFVALLAALGEPFRRTCWSFSYGQARWQTTWFGIGPSRTYPVDWLDRIDLRRRGPGHFGFRTGGGQPSGERLDYALVFVGRENNEILTIDGLSEGEARWMADVVLRECHRWFQ